MKYFLLAQWVKENRQSGQVIDKILHTSPCVYIRFKSGSSLVCFYKTANPFPILYKTDQEGQKLWQFLETSEIQAITISENDRIIYVSLLKKDIYQSLESYVLVFECMPPQGNLIICKTKQDGLEIIDAVHKFSYADNPRRQILPGLIYEPPGTGFQAEQGEVIFPLSVKDALTGGNIPCLTLNDYFVNYYHKVEVNKELLLKKDRLKNKWKRELIKAEGKLGKQSAELETANLEETWLAYSEIIKVNLGNIRNGDTVLSAVNYRDPEMTTIEIPLLPELSPKENLNHYLKKYQKAKQGKNKIIQQITQTNQEINEIREIINRLDSDQWHDLLDREDSKNTIISHLKQTDKLLKIQVNADWEILIGRKSTENDLLVTKIGRPEDWWFHTRIYHGSHVLLRNYRKQQPGEQLVSLCCSLAAGYSKAKHSSNVPVDYTQIRYVRKPRKSAPGYVTYTNQKTVFADPIDAVQARERLNSNA